MLTVVHHIEEEVLGLFSMSDHKIMELIYATHVHADENFDDDSLFIIVENILKRATQIVDKVVQVYVYSHAPCCKMCMNIYVHRTHNVTHLA